MEFLLKKYLKVDMSDDPAYFCKLKAGQDLVIKKMLQVGPGDDYTLTVGGFNDAKSTLGHSMYLNNGMKFTTK